MLVVADTGPLNYLVLIGHIDVLQALFSRVVIPSSVQRELQNISGPSDVRRWAESLPTWVEVRTPSLPGIPLKMKLDRGEQDALFLASELDIKLVLIDEIRGRAEAKRQHLKTTGTLGVLQRAHYEGFLELREAISELRSTSFWAPDELFESVLTSVYGES